MSPSDRDDDPFDDAFRLMEQFMENMAENMDRMLGPYGSVEFDVDHQYAPPEAESTQASGDTHVDVHEGDEEVRVVADVPGVSEEDVEVRCDGRTLSITADGDGRTYDERARLPARVDERAASATYKNGILEVVLERRGTGSDGTSIEVE